MRRISHFFIRRPAKGNDRLFRSDCVFPLVLVLGVPIYTQGQARGYGRITRQNLVFQLPFWGQHFKPQIKKDG